MKALLAGRATLAKIIDHGSSVSRVDSGSPRLVAAWRFTSAHGTALTCVNVADEPHTVAFPGTSGTWKDVVKEEPFTASGNTLHMPVPAHRVRLLRSEA